MSRLQSRRWLQAEASVLALVYLGLGLVIARAPRELVVVTGSIDAFEIMPNVLTIDTARWLWGAAFGVCGVLVAVTAVYPTETVQQVTQLAAFFADGLWATALILPLFAGRGSAPFAVVFPVILLWTGFVLARVRDARGPGG